MPGFDTFGQYDQTSQRDDAATQATMRDMMRGGSTGSLGAASPWRFPTSEIAPMTLPPPANGSYSEHPALTAPNLAYQPQGNYMPGAAPNNGFAPQNAPLPWAQSPQSAQPPTFPYAAQQQQAAPSQADPIEALGGRAETLWRRLLDIEQALSVQEWWMLGRELPEARQLAEIVSLLAVARGELENTLAQFFGRPIPRSDATDQFPVVEGPTPTQLQDEAWLAASRDQAAGLLGMVHSALPPMAQYAEMLQTYSGRLGLAPAVIDSFGIVTERMREMDEALRS